MDFATTGEFWRLQWFEFYNESGETIPPFACLRIIGATTRNNRTVIRVGKPNTYGAQYHHRFNGPTQVTAGTYGVCTIGPHVTALYETADGTPAFGERWGPRDATWKLKKHTGGFQIVGNVDSNNGLVTVTPSPFLSFTGRCDAAIAKDAAGTVSIFYRSGNTALTDTTVNQTNVLNSSCDAALNDYVHCVWEGDSSTSYWKMV